MFSFPQSCHDLFLSSFFFYSLFSLMLFVQLRPLNINKDANKKVKKSKKVETAAHDEQQDQN